MKSRDYRRLARLSLASHKRTTIQTIVGISFGLILLFPLLFIALGFYGGFYAEVNKNPSYRSFNIDYQTATNPYHQAIYQEYNKDVEKLSGLKKEIKYTQINTFASNRNIKPFIELDGEEIVLGDRYNNTFVGISIIDKEYGEDPFITADYLMSTGNPVVTGRTFSKGEQSKGEIMVSYQFLLDYKLSSPLVLGKKISFYHYLTPSGVAVSDSKEVVHSNPDLKSGGLVPYFISYDVVGIFSRTLHSNKSIRNLALNTTGNNASTIKEYFWVTSASIGSDEENMGPELCLPSNTESSPLANTHWYYYSDKPETMAEKITNNGYMFLPYGLGIVGKTNAITGFSKSQLLEFDTFSSARGAYNELCYYYGYDANSSANVGFALPGFSVYLSFYDIFLYVCIAFGALGGVIFLATLLNLLNTLHFSVQSMRGFLGICRAQGMKNFGVIRLFIDQILWIFFFSSISMIIFGGGLCILLKNLYDTRMSKIILDRTSVTFTIEWWYIPIALGIIFVLMTILSFLFSYLLAGKTSKTPILEILQEDNK